MVDASAVHEKIGATVPLRLRGAGDQAPEYQGNEDPSDVDKGGDAKMGTTQNPPHHEEVPHKDDDHGMDIQTDDTERSQNEEADRKSCNNADDNEEDHSQPSEITGEVAEDAERKSVFVHGLPSDCRPRDFFNLFRYFSGFEYSTVRGSFDSFILFSGGLYLCTHSCAVFHGWYS
jgi:hypothetical protein